MKSKQEIFSLMVQLWHKINSPRKMQFVLLLALMPIVSLSEIVSIGAVLPFLGVLTAPERIFSNDFFRPFIENLNITNHDQLLLPITIIFICSVTVAAFMRLLLFWGTTRLSFSTGAELSADIYRRTLYQPYAVHCSRNSSEIINAISVKTNSIIYGIISPTLILISSSVILMAILATLLWINPIVAFGSFGVFGFIYIAVIVVTRKKLLTDSQCIARESTNIIKSLQEGLGGIRDVLINGCQEIYCEIFQNADIPLRRAQGNHMFIGQSPRYIIEAIGMIFIAIIAYLLSKKSDEVASAIPILGALALGAQRLLPVLQQIYSSWVSICANQSTLKDIIKLLDQPFSPQDNSEQSRRDKLPFNHSICLKQVSFSYGPQSPTVLKKIDLIIAKGGRIGFIGKTGSGKSTLLDLLMGLLEPTEGCLEIDGRLVTAENFHSWQAHLAHVPQVIFLTDASIEENIAFGVPSDKIDKVRVQKAAKQAQISSFIENLPEQYLTFVGERGVRLSGGQRQRIGIARALYKQANVILFDEATSALDNQTENGVMNAINSLNKDLTLIIVAHRLTTLQGCTQIVELSDGEVKSTRLCN